MVTDAAVTGVSGASASDVVISVAWNPQTQYVVADGTPPREYRPLETVGHSGGTLDGCSLSIAVALPRPTTKRFAPVGSTSPIKPTDTPTWPTRTSRLPSEAVIRGGHEHERGGVLRPGGRAVVPPMAALGYHRIGGYENDEPASRGILTSSEGDGTASIGAGVRPVPVPRLRVRGRDR